ncbi:MAG: Gfo/Idh/MocA family oxidoreductase [Holosporaceae bacterium]|jgi:predicted dehydrogenase|nr:Gfo/Idh/MocA family oxidoreductase [Holosporaceae bacterium]
MVYNVLIVGAGQIASGFDFSDSEDILTHAHAYTKHNGFNLVGFYDVAFEKAKLAAQKWDCDCFENISNVKSKIDVISICTPDNYHVTSIRQIVELLPKLIFLEKPIPNNASEIAYLMDIAKSVPIAVNYSRRYVKEFQELSRRIFFKEFGEFVTGVGHYGKGFMHNGSHMIDLLRLLIGNIGSVKTVTKIKDFYPNDPSKNVDVFFENNARFSMHVIDCNNYTIFELDLFFEKARIRILDSGFKIEIYKIVENKVFNGYRKLQKNMDYSTQLNSAMFSAMDNIFNFLVRKEKLLCNICDGYEAIRYA